MIGNPARLSTLSAAKARSDVPSALAAVIGFGAETAWGKWRRLQLRLSQRARKAHYGRTAQVLAAGESVSGYEQALEDLLSMSEPEALEVLVCMARRSARWHRESGGGPDRFGQVQWFLDQLSSVRVADQRIDLLRKLSLEAVDEFERRATL